jgi:hypothetical protein
MMEAAEWGAQAIFIDYDVQLTLLYRRVLYLRKFSKFHRRLAFWEAEFWPNVKFP